MATALPIAWLNGEYLPLDRGFLFGDAVYEVIAVFGGRPVLLEPHLARLARSLRELAISDARDAAAWREVLAGLVERNGGGDMALYLQVSRGADAGRDHGFPRGVAPTAFAMASPLAPVDLDRAGVRAITRPDNRWGRCDIKSTALLANVLLRQAAIEAGAGETIMLRDGFVTEGSSSSVLVLEGRTLVTRPNGPEILPGTTIELVRELAARLGIGYREEPVGEGRLRAADEVWITAAGRGVAPVTHVDGRPVGSGAPGPAWRAVAEAYERHKRA